MSEPLNRACCRNSAIIFLLLKQRKKNTVDCFRNTDYKILTNTWYNKRKVNKHEERLRVVRAIRGLAIK